MNLLHRDKWPTPTLLLRLIVVAAAFAIPISSGGAIMIGQTTYAIDSTNSESALVDRLAAINAAYVAAFDARDSLALARLQLPDVPSNAHELEQRLEQRAADVVAARATESAPPLTGFATDERAFEKSPSLARIEAVVKDLRELTAAFGEASKINYDADLEIQTIGDLLTHGYPSLFTRNDILEILPAIAHGKPNLAMRTRLAAIAALHRAQLRVVSGDLSTLDPAAAPYSHAGYAAVTAANKYDALIAAQALLPVWTAESANRIYRSSRSSTAATLSAVNASISRCGELLRARIAAEQKKRIAIFIFGLAAIIFGTFCVSLIGRNMARHARELLRLAELEKESLAAEIHRLGIERALRLAEARFKTVFEVARIGIAVFGPDCELLECNASLAAIIGQDPGEFLAGVQPNVERFAAGSNFPNEDEDHELIGDDGARWISVTTSGVYENGACVLIILTIVDVTEQRALEQRLRHEANTDVLTRLGNRAAFETELDAAVAGAAESPFALFFIDLDYFKQVNDTYGHAAGDTVLTVASDRLRSILKRSDFIARLGGDEFAVILRNYGTRSSVEAIGERLQSAICLPIVMENNAAHISASIGIAFSGAHTEAKQIVHDADTAMYASKTNGRGRQTVFNVASDLGLNLDRNVEFSPIESDVGETTAPNAR